MFTREQVVGAGPGGPRESSDVTVAGFAWRHQYGASGPDRGREALSALLSARRAFAWMPYRSLTVICEPPQELHVERSGRQWRLHNSSGPAVVWGGEGEDREFFLHGVRIPEHLFGDDLRIQDLHYEAGDEVRRALIERMGWPAYAQRAKLRLVASAPDPGNGAAELKLYALPRSVYDSSRLLMMVNGSPDRTGRRHDYAELVPDEYDDPIEAAAWQYGCPVEVYRQLARRT
jgi:hypothetical protein